VLPGSILRKLTSDELDVYRRPFREPGESRRPTLTWPRQIPFEGEPKDVHESASVHRTAGADCPERGAIFASTRAFSSTSRVGLR
jgi:hypothetical protein